MKNQSMIFQPLINMVSVLPISQVEASFTAVVKNWEELEVVHGLEQSCLPHSEDASEAPSATQSPPWVVVYSKGPHVT